MIPDGYILLSRQLADSEIWRKPPHYLKLWIYLLLKANHSPKQNGQRLGRGQCLVTIADLCEHTSYYKGYTHIRTTKDQIWRALVYLRKSDMIATTKTTRGLVVTIRNYNRYQNGKNYERDSVRATNATAPRHDRQECKERKGEAASPPAQEPFALTPTPQAAKGNGAAGRIIALWITSHTERTSTQFPKGAKGKLAGMIKRLLADFPESDLREAAGCWFGRQRSDYGVELFKAKLEGGDTELTGRAGGTEEDDQLAQSNWQRLQAGQASASFTGGES